MRAIREMNHDLDPFEMPRPIGLRTDIADRSKQSTVDRFRRTSRSAENGMAAVHEFAAQCAADETCSTGHQNARHTSPFTAIT
jgi:hypothetical protein